MRMVQAVKASLAVFRSPSAWLYPLNLQSRIWDVGRPSREDFEDCKAKGRPGT